MKFLSKLMIAVTLLVGVSASAQTTPTPQEPFGVPHLQESIANAEAEYVAGGPGVTEEELVTFHNHLVDVLGLPDYAKVDQAQVRFLRMNHVRLGLGPHDDITPKLGEATTEISHIMSPMVAASLEDSVILNKRFNAGFHQLPGQWNRKTHFEQFNLQDIDKIEQKDSGTDKSKEITKALHKKGSLSYEEAAKLLYWLSETFKLSPLDTAEIAALALEGK